LAWGWFGYPKPVGHPKKEKKKIILGFGSWGGRTTLIAVHGGCSLTLRPADLGRPNLPPSQTGVAETPSKLLEVVLGTPILSKMVARATPLFYFISFQIFFLMFLIF